MEDSNVVVAKERSTLRKFKANPDGTPDTSDGPSEELVYEDSKLVRHVKLLKLPGGKVSEINLLDLDKEKLDGTD